MTHNRTNDAPPTAQYRDHGLLRMVLRVLGKVVHYSHDHREPAALTFIPTQPTSAERCVERSAFMAEAWNAQDATYLADWMLGGVR